MNRNDWRTMEINRNHQKSLKISGNQKEIDEWRIKTSYKKTKKQRPDLLDQILKSNETKRAFFVDQLTTEFSTSLYISIK